MTNSRSHMSQIFKRDNGMCHYCSAPVYYKNCGLSPAGRRQATKDHVFPKSMGGPNAVHNYVLSCYECNNDRGTQLHYCKCVGCTHIITNYMNTDRIINEIFEGMIQANRVKVRRHNDGTWSVRLFNSTNYFPSFAEAIAFAYTTETKNGKKVR